MNTEPTGFLYPFIEAEEHDSLALVSDLAASAFGKMSLSADLRTATLERSVDIVERTVMDLVERFRRGGRLFCFGNGGSSTDAEGTVDLFRNPPDGHRLPAISLVEDPAVLTALANDVGFDLAYSRQIIASAREVDIALGFS